MNDPTEALALVTAAFRGARYVLLIERGGGAGWAMPGGAIEPGRHPGAAALRGLDEEAGLGFVEHPLGLDEYLQDMSGRNFPIASGVLDEPCRMPDPDGAVTVVARCDLGEVDALPEVRGGGDHGCFAEWLSLGYLKLREREIFPAHREILGALQ